MIKAALTVMGLAMVCLLVSAFGTLQAQGDAVARGLVQERCASCHNLGRVKRNVGRIDAKAWDDTVARMQRNGARLTDEERAAIVEFLASLKSGQEL